MPYRGAKHPAGSAAWVLDERSQASNAVDQEAGDFAFSAANQLEWLNEHMSDIFSQNPLTMTEISKTPGKLRGRTPMTARRRNALEERAPLTDVFASTPNAHASPSHNTQFYKQVSKLQVAENKENEGTPQPKPTRGHESRAVDRVEQIVQYEPLGQDAAARPLHPTKATSPPKSIFTTIPADRSIKHIQSPPKPVQIARLEQEQKRRSETVESFVSAKESPSGNQSLNEDTVVQRSTEKLQTTFTKEPQTSQTGPRSTPLDKASPVACDAAKKSDVALLEKMPTESLGQEAAQEAFSPSRSESDDLSETSSPERPILRKKSSLTFATLPSRDTTLPKKSMGPQASRTSIVENTRKTQARLPSSPQEVVQTQSQLVHSLAQVETRPSHLQEADEKVVLVALPQQDSPEVRIHSKTSTQRLHERITMLSKMNPPRPSKSISAAFVSQPSAQDIQAESRNLRDVDDDDDDWIDPVGQKSQDTRTSAALLNHSTTLQPEKSTSVVESQVSDTVEAPEQASQVPPDPLPSSISYPKLPSPVIESTTPAGSPVRKQYVDGPLSASKAKLFDMFKSARGIFASSAGAGAHAKAEPLSKHDMASHSTAAEKSSEEKQDSLDSRTVEPVNLQGKDPEPEPVQLSRRSSARIAQQKEQQTAQAEIIPLAAPSEEPDKTRPTADSKQADLKKSLLSSSQMSKHGELRRPGPKPAQEGPAKNRPAPVSVRVASQRMGHAQSVSTNLNSSVNDSQPQATHQRQPSTLKTKGSNSSIKSGLTGTIGKTGGTTGSRPKALEAAARKREQDEREAQRKADLKRDIERRRAAKAEEERRAALEQKEQKMAEQRAAEAKQAAQRQAADQRRTEALKKAEQVPRPQSSLAHYEKQPPREQTSSRNDFRPIPKASASQDDTRHPAPHMNPAKPPKRYFNPEEDEQPKRTFGQKSAGPVQQAQNPAKRRRTSEMEGTSDGQSRPTMGAPVRLSAMQKSATSSKFAPGYISATAPSQTGPSMLKTAINGQYQSHHPKTPHDMTKFSNAKIPFADPANAQAPHTAQRPQAGIFKTPGTANSKHAAARSSPMFPEGDNISLPEIATDSEDEDSDDEGFVPPEWANSPALRELLSQQQLVDPMKVFGPIAPLQMEEIFKGNKERIVKFRKRTSSANWNGPDRLTEEERRKDFEAREKLMRDGAWSFNPNV